MRDSGDYDEDLDRGGRARFGRGYNDDLSEYEGGYSRAFDSETEWGAGYGGGYGRSGGYGERGGGGAGRAPDSGSFGRNRAERGEFGRRDFGGDQWRGRESFAGRGPKNYKRSDARIEEEINEALTRHPDIDASDIEVRVQSGQVTLVGFVDSRPAKRLAEDIAESALGVEEVTNQLRVNRGRDGEVRGAADREVDRTTSGDRPRR